MKSFQPFRARMFSRRFTGLSLALAVTFAIAPLAQATQEDPELDHSQCSHECLEGDMDGPPLEPSPDFIDTYPDGTIPKPEGESEHGTAGIAGPIAPAAGQPPGALTGRIVYTGAGHGWYKPSGNWGLQRPLLLEMNEDYGNLDQMAMFAQYCFNAGATVVPFRPIGYQTNEVVVDNVDSAVIWQGAWNNSTSSIYYGNPGEIPYRWAAISSSETATATYVPNIPEKGFYPVYTWAQRGGNRTNQLYRIRHTGGESQVRIPHHMVGNGWVYLGTYYFNAGSSAAQGAVVISNLQPSPVVGSVAIADAIRFGNGMSNDGSTYPKEDEAANFYVKNSLGQGQLSSLHSSHVSAPPKMAREMNFAPNSPIFKSVYLGFHTNGGSGNRRGSKGLHNGNHPGTSTPNQLRWAEIVGQEINDQMVAMSPFLEVPWHNLGSDVTLSRSDIAFGEIHNDWIKDEFDATIIESGYHDNTLDARILRDPKARNWIARASYRAVVKYMNEFDNGPLVFLPEPPRNARAVANDSGGVEISWDLPVASAGSGAPASYVVYRSTNGYGFGNPVFVSGGASTSTTITGLPPGTNHFFRVAARNAGGESFPSGTVGCRLPSSPSEKRVLFVNGYTRFDRTINIRQTPQSGNYRPPGHNGNSGVIDRVIPRRVNSFDYVVQHGEALAAAGAAFDSCRRDAVASGSIDLAHYDVVVWASGQESVQQRTFHVAERNRVSTFLNNGGALFVSGSEIAFDLDRPSGPTTAERQFLREVLRAEYASADSQNYVVSPAAGSAFAGLSGASFDSGPGGVYPVRSPDTVLPHGPGAVAAFAFGGGTGTAAVQYDGSAGGGRVVYLTFPFETILQSATRDQYMANAIEFLTEEPEPAPPTIAAQPVSLDAYAGGEVVLSVAASGVPAPEYQWQLDGVDIDGANEATLTLDSVTAAQGGVYRVIVSNAEGAVTSEAATLSVFRAPDRPAFAATQIGDDAQFEAVFVAPPGPWFLVEESPNLEFWEPFTAFEKRNAPVRVTDPDALIFDRKFYQAREVPVFAFTNFESYGEGEMAMFRQPSFSGSTGGHIETDGDLPNFTRATTAVPAGIDSAQVLHASWSFLSGTTNPWLRLTTSNAPNLPNPTVDFSHGIRFNVYVDRPIYLALGLRETNATAAIGADGGTDGDIEWVGGRTNNSVSPPLGKLIAAGEWTAVHFFIPFEPVRGHTGNGILESTTGKGVLENLTIVPADGTGIYNLYLDNFRAIEFFP